MRLFKYYQFQKQSGQTDEKQDGVRRCSGRVNRAG